MKHKPEDYKGIRTWGEANGAKEQDIVTLQALAAKDEAPLDSIFVMELGIGADRWFKARSAGKGNPLIQKILEDAEVSK